MNSICLFSINDYLLKCLMKSVESDHCLLGCLAHYLSFYLLVQNSVEARVAGVEMTAAAVGTCKESLNRSWGCSGKILRRSSQYSASTEMECSSENFDKVSRQSYQLREECVWRSLFIDGGCN